jgi:hypothetical protein
MYMLQWIRFCIDKTQKMGSRSETDCGSKEEKKRAVL